MTRFEKLKQCLTPMDVANFILFDGVTIKWCIDKPDCPPHNNCFQCLSDWLSDTEPGETDAYQPKHMKED